MNARTTPALVTQRAATPLPRWLLWLLCALYLVPGSLAREPWRNEELASFGVMAAMADGRTNWWQPTLGGVEVLSNWPAHAWGSLAIQLANAIGPIPPSLATRWAFLLILAAVLTLTWSAIYRFARSEAAQPVAFAFGGEASPIDYARSLADSGLLALIATLGLLQLGHEGTPDLMRLLAVTLLLWGLAALGRSMVLGPLAVLAGPALLALHDSPVLSVLLPLGLAAVMLTRGASGARCAMTLAASAVLGAIVTQLTGDWESRWAPPSSAEDLVSAARLLLWFLWPAWPLAFWTLWRWHGHWREPHLLVPAAAAGILVGSAVLSEPSDRWLLLSLPAVAMLAAFALPTLRRGTRSAIDWFSVCFFTVCALAIWVIYVSMHTGWPEQPRANVFKLAPGFEPSTSWFVLATAATATVAWFFLLRWRTGRTPDALWKSLILPASGVALCWVLLMTLWLPLLDYARGLSPWVARLKPSVGANPDCVAAPGLAAAYVAALEIHGGWTVDARKQPVPLVPCSVLLLSETRQGRKTEVPAGWRRVAEIRRPTERNETTVVYRRSPHPQQNPER